MAGSSLSPVDLKFDIMGDYTITSEENIIKMLISFPFSSKSFFQYYIVHIRIKEWQIYSNIPFDKVANGIYKYMSTSALFCFWEAYHTCIP